MADKMMRLAGRGTDGKAKAVKSDNDGNIGVHLSRKYTTGRTATVPANGSVQSAVIDTEGAHSLMVTGWINLPGLSEGKKQVDVVWYADPSGNTRVAEDLRITKGSRTSTQLGSATISVKSRYAKFVFRNLGAVEVTINYQYALHSAPSESQSNEGRIVLWDAQSTDDTKTLDVNGNYTMTLDVSLMQDGLIEVEDEFGKPLTSVNTYTRNEQPSIAEAGIYHINVEGVDLVRVKYQPSYVGRSTTAAAKFSKTRTVTPQSRQKHYPTTEVLYKKNSYESPRAMSQDGKIMYARRDNSLRVSTDFGENWTTAYTGPTGTQPWHVLPTTSGRVVAVRSDNVVVTSDVNGGNFTETLTMDVGMNTLFGADVYRDICLLAEYRATKSTPSLTSKVYMSVDAGQTWKTIFDAVRDIPNLPGNFHLHDVRYDPYESIIWLTTGDGPTAKNILYSMDMGNTWNKVADWGKAPLQSVTIIPMPECVLFMGDAYHVGVLRYNRPPGGTRPGQKFAFDRALIIQNSWVANEVPIPNVPAINYENAQACFGWLTNVSALSSGNNYRLRSGNLYATKNGYDFYEVFQSGKVIDSQSGVRGIGYDHEGNVNFLFVDSTQGEYPVNIRRMKIDWKPV